ncbi:hypothetical protein Taro_019520, partial [Colocasia esculenta]|nr:hypothetical protein [Colocasia esculenta]
MTYRIVMTGHQLVQGRDQRRRRRLQLRMLEGPQISNIEFFIATKLRLHKGKPLMLLRSEKLGVVATQTAGDDWCGHGFRWESLWRVETEGEEKESSRNFAGRRRKVQICRGL